MINCVNIEGKLVQSDHHEIECFSLTHTFYFLIAIIGLLILIPMTILITLLFFESTKNKSQISARTDSFNQFATLLIYTFLQFIWSFSESLYIVQISDIRYIYIYI